MKYITYNHTSHARYISNGAVFQEILSCYIISILCNVDVVYHNSWKYCGFISHNSFQKHTSKPKREYEQIVHINQYIKWESITYQNLVSIKTFIHNCKDNTLIVLGNVCLINPSYLYRWYREQLLDKDFYSELFLPQLRKMYFYDNCKEPINQFYIHIRNGDIGKVFYDKGLNVEYYKNIIKLINSRSSNLKINIMYEGDSKKTTLDLTSCYKNERVGYNHLWPRELGKLPNVILNEGDLDNLRQHINELSRSKYLLLSPSTLAYYSGTISNGLKFVDKRMIEIHPNALTNTVDLPQFTVFDDFKDILQYLNA